MIFEQEKAPFVVPFIISLTFGIPVVAGWFFVATKIGILANAITILLGAACGFGARIASGGLHAYEAALLSTLLLIILGISIVTISILASESGNSFLIVLTGLLKNGSFNDFANACVNVAGKTFYGYPIGLHAAHRVSDPD